MNRVVKLNQLWQLTVALFREIIREPGVLFWGILFPILMSVGLGLAFTKKTDVIRKIAVINPAEIQQSANGKNIVADFLQKNCEKSSNSKNSPWKWKYVIRDEKLGNSIFLFYEMSWK